MVEGQNLPAGSGWKVGDRSSPTIQKEFSPAHLGAESGRQPVLGHSIEVGHQAAGFGQRGKQPLIMPDIVIG